MKNPYRPPSEQEAPQFHSAAHRVYAGRSFTQGAATYDDVRPSYPDHVVDFLLDASGGTTPTVVDIGAGTGKLTEKLAGRAGTCVALDPSADMAATLRAKGLSVVRATAEATGLAAGSVDAATFAQTWHWLDIPATCRELDRVVREGGRVGLVWNTINVGADPWILRLARIMHSGDIQRPGFRPEVAKPWSITDELRTSFSDVLTPERLHHLMHTRSYWLRAKEKTRQRMTDNLNWYLYDHLGFRPDEPVELPYRTDAFILER